MNNTINQLGIVSTSSTISDTSILLIGIIMQAAMSAPGLAPNLAIVYITWKYKILHTIYGCFLAQAAFWDAVTEFAFLLPLTLLLIRQTIPLLPCFCIQFYDIFGLINALYFMLAISLDRLCAIVAPIRYMLLANHRKWMVVYGTSGALLLFSSIEMYFMLLYAIQNSNRQVYCLAADIVQGPIAPFAYYCTLSLSILLFAVYALIGILMKMGGLKFAKETNQQRIFKSLAVITTIIFICFTANYSLRAAMAPFPIDPSIKALLNKLIGNLSRLSGTVNAPVLFICSSHYREAICKEFKWMARLNKWISSTKVQAICLQSIRPKPPTIADTNGQHNNPQ